MSTTKLRRDLGFWGAFVTGVGLVVAATTLTSLGNGFGQGGLAFGVAAFAALVVSILIAFSYSELANMLPGAGMIGDYTAPALGRLPAIFGVLAGYIVLVATVEPAELLVSGLAMNQFVPALPPAFFAVLLTTLFFVVNLLGVKSFGWAQVLVTGVMMGSVAIFGIIGLLGIGEGTPLDSPPAFNPAGWGSVFQLMALGIYLYIGIEFVCPMSEEVRNPGRNIPRAMIFGLITVFVVDMLFGVASTLYVDLEELGTSATPHLLSAEGIAGGVGLTALTIATVFASASSVSAILAAVPRMLYGLAREGMLPSIFGYIHPRFRTPWVSIGLVFVLIVLALLTFANSDAILALILIATVTWLASYILAQVDVIVLRSKYPEAARGFRTPFYPVPQIVGIAACIWMIIGIHPDPGMRATAWFGAGAFTLAIIAYAVIWLKFVKGIPLFKAVPLDEEMKVIHERTESETQASEERVK